MALRVGIVEDNQHLRADFARLVDGAGDMTCVATFASAEAALIDLPATAPDVVLMDINLPGMTGIECTRRLHADAPKIQIVMLTAFDDSELVFESLKAGASGYILKRAPAAEIIEAIRDVHAGGAPMSGTIARKVVQFFGQRNQRAPRAAAPEVDALSARERAVLEALSEGQFYKEIADSLEISINTVRKHIKSIYEKLQVHTRLEAVAKLGRV
ncbi:MAG: response regulator transcription factor [Acidobacteria bacterium]|nr:response regulator transcription factor [Acidobacteriota bacterium]